MQLPKIRKRTWLTSSGKKRTAWRAQFTIDGKRRSLSGDTRGEVEEQIIRLFETEEAKDDLDTLTVKGACDIWLEACRLGRNGRDPVERSTLVQYERHVLHHIVPHYGGLKISSITDPKLVQIRDEMLRRHSRAMSKKVFTSLKSILRECKSRGHSVKSIGESIGINVGGRHKEQVEIPSRQEVSELLTESAKKKDWSGKRFYIFLSTMVATGCRPSELRALTKDGLDLGNRLVEVFQRADEWNTIGSPKSRAGHRKIPISESLRDLLENWLTECPDPYLFGTKRGAADSLTNITSRHWYPLQEAVFGERRYDLKSLRHFHASQLIASGATPKEIMNEMGHSTIQMTFDIYGHLFADDMAERLKRADLLSLHPSNQ